MELACEQCGGLYDHWMSEEEALEGLVALMDSRALEADDPYSALAQWAGDAMEDVGLCEICQLQLTTTGTLALYDREQRLIALLRDGSLVQPDEWDDAW